MREVGKALAGLLLAALLLWWVFHDKDPDAIWAALGRASILGLVIGAALNFAHNLPRIWRWHSLLLPVTPGVRFRPMFAAVVIGYMTTWTIPGRLGELVRPALLSAKERVPLGPCLGTVLADRILDGAAIVVLFAVGTFLSDLSGEALEHAALIRSTAVVMVAVVTIPLALLLVATLIRARLDAWFEGRSGALRWLGRTLLSLSEGTEAFRRPRLLVRIAVHSLAAWLVIGLGTWIGLRACGADIAFPAVLVLLPLLALGVALPTPGGAGGYHAAVAFGLTKLFGVSPETAVGAGILMHLAVTLPVIAVGLVLLRTEHVSWRDLLAAAREVRRLGSRTEVSARPNALEDLS